MRTCSIISNNQTHSQLSLDNLAGSDAAASDKKLSKNTPPNGRHRLSAPIAI